MDICTLNRYGMLIYMAYQIMFMLHGDVLALKFDSSVCKSFRATLHFNHHLQLFLNAEMLKLFVPEFHKYVDFEIFSGS